jgi:DNA-binding transcriptional LysR family regulator
VGVSHPTVARRVRSPETVLGARLFDRLPDRFVLTGAGEEVDTQMEGKGSEVGLDSQPTF